MGTSWCYRYSKISSNARLHLLPACITRTIQTNTDLLGAGMDFSHDWFRRRANQTLFLCIGALIGVALVLPLGWHLPDVYANLLGGVVGSVATIAGAFLVLNRQIRDADERLKQEINDRNSREHAAKDEVERKAQMRLDRLQRAVAGALHGDLKTAKAICEVQLSQAKEALSWPKPAQQIWCQRIANLPMVAFDRLGYLLSELGDLSPTLIYIQSQAARFASMVKSEVEIRRDVSNFSEIVEIISTNLPTFVDSLKQAMDHLEPLIDTSNLGKRVA
jgi:hypothetical protein